MNRKPHLEVDAPLKEALAGSAALVVDDHDPIRKAIRRVLESAGFGKVIESTDVSGAKKVLATLQPVLVVCDLNLGQTSGFEVVEHIRQSDFGSDVPLLIVTGESSREDIVKAVDRGANDYMLKPFQAEDLEKKAIALARSFIFPGDLLRLIRGAESQLIQGDFQTAFVAADQALLTDSKNQRARFIRAFALYKMGRAHEAELALGSLIAENPSNFRSLGLLADIKHAAGNRREAIELMERELELNSNHPDRQTRLGMLLLEQSRPADAINHLRSALLHAPKHRQALLVMGQAQARAGNIDKALYYFTRLRRNYPDAREALEAVVETCEQIKDLRRAEIVLRDERKTHPEQNDAGVLLARVYFMQEKLEDTIALASELSEGGQSVEAAIIQAMALSKAGKELEALTALEAIKSTDDEAWLNRIKAELHLKLERHANAEVCALRSFAAQPWSSAPLVLQGEALLNLDSPAKAWFVFARAQKMGSASDHMSDMVKTAHSAVSTRRKPGKPAAKPGRRIAS